MNSWDFIKENSIIVTADGVLAIYTDALPDGCGGYAFRSPTANNIADNIIYGGLFRIREGWRYATKKESERLIKLSNLYQ